MFLWTLVCPCICLCPSRFVYSIGFLIISSRLYWPWFLSSEMPNSNGERINTGNGEDMPSVLEIDSTRPPNDPSLCCLNAITGRRKAITHWIAVILSVLAVVVGQSAATLSSRFYFDQGGVSRWLQTLLPCVGWPILLIPMLFTRRRRQPMGTSLTIKYVVICVGLGVLSVGDQMLYSWGVSFLPASTFSLLCATQLAFTAMLAYILVQQKITPYILNSIVLLTFSAILLGVHSNNDRLEGVSNHQFILGFACTIGASFVFALILPLMQLVFKNVVRNETFGVVVETQAYIYMVATVVSVVGLLGSGDFRHLKDEAHNFKSGMVVYYMTLIWSAIGWQVFYLGLFGLIYLVSSLFSNVISTVTLAIVPILAIVFFNDKLDAIKAMAMLLGLWGFVSYVFGGFMDS
eukprot:Gb_00299 [translate_table: standard]